MRVDPTNHPQYSLITSISESVLAAERDMDNSIATLAKLVGATVEEFGQAELPGSMSQPALSKLAEALTAHIDSRRLLVEAHRQYGRTAKMLGATAEDWGPWWPCPSGQNTEAKPVSQPLRVVA